MEFQYCFIYAAFVRVRLSKFIISVNDVGIEFDDLAEFLDSFIECAFFFICTAKFEKYFRIASVALPRSRITVRP